jgi:hypothetical protein
MFHRLLPVGVLAVSTLFLAGCGPAKLDISKTYTIGGDAEHAKGFELDPQSKPQTLTIEFSSSGGDVEAVVFKKSDAADMDAVAMAAPSKALASKKGKNETFTVEIPENTGVWVAVMTAGDKKDVTLKVTNKK